MEYAAIASLAIVLGLIPAEIARCHGGNFGFYWVLGTVALPVGLVLAVLHTDDRRRCRHCDETIRPMARVCPHCRNELAPHHGILRPQ